jgi:HlyD family secretion protein
LLVAAERRLCMNRSTSKIGGLAFQLTTGPRSQYERGARQVVAGDNGRRNEEGSEPMPDAWCRVDPERHAFVCDPLGRLSCATMCRADFFGAARMLAAVILGLAAAAGGCRGGEEGRAPVPAAGAANSARQVEPVAVTAIGRLEPKDGLRHVAGPSRPSVVIAKLLVEEGDRVTAGQAIAVLDSLGEDQARVTRAKAQLENAQRDLNRIEPMARQGVASVANRDDAQLKVDVAKADLAAAQSALDLDTVHAPTGGQVIAIHARAGERVGPDGIAELASNDAMYAVAEVYETDIGRVKVGQRARVSSPAVDPALTGTVERIGMKIGKKDVLDTDPVARVDARVVEVRIRLDDSKRAASLSNLKVDVALEP